MRRLWLKIRKRFHLERDLDEEMNLHRELSSREFGSLMRIREEARELWTFPFIENLLRDLRHACRTLTGSPSYTLVCLFTLALGIGMNTTVFTLYDSLTYRLLPVHAPEQLARVVRRTGGKLQPTNTSWAEFEHLRSSLGTMADAIATKAPQIVIGTIPTAMEAREGLKTQFVTADYFDVLGIQAETGRMFRADDKPAAVISYMFWSRRLQADPGIVGKTIHLGSEQFEIVGVASKAFYGSDLPPRTPDLWIPFIAHDHEAKILHVLARRKSGVTVQQVSAALQKAAGTQTLPDGQGSSFAAVDATAFQANMGAFRGTGTIGLILMGAVAAILLICCANLINLTLSRNAARQREIAIRLSLGASRRRVVQQLFIESLLLGLLGGLAGLWLSIAFCRWVRSDALRMVEQLAGEVVGSFHLDLSPDWRVFAYTLAISMSVAALIGIWPALGATRRDINPSSKTKGPHKRQRHLLLTAQIAACFVFLAGAGLLFRGAWQSRSADPGFRSDRVLAVGVDLTYLDGGASERVEGLRQILKGTRTAPGVLSMALVDRAPFLGTGSAAFDSESQKDVKCRFNRVSAGYFETLGIPILAGRSFNEAEVEQGEAVVVVSEGAAKRFWPDENPVGRHIYVDPRLRGGPFQKSYTVVGIAKAVRNTFLSKQDDNYLYFSRPLSDAGGWILLQTLNSPEQAIPLVRDALAQASQAVASHSYVVTLENGPIMIQKLMTDVPGMVALVLGLVALILASVGVYGLVTYLVAQRIREIGIHMAIGAQRGDVVWLVLREGLSCAGWGTGLGLLGAICVSGLLAKAVSAPDLPDLTYQAGVFDPITFLAATAALALGVTTACLLPVWRATRVDPAIALRSD